MCRFSFSNRMKLTQTICVLAAYYTLYDNHSSILVKLWKCMMLANRTWSKTSNQSSQRKKERKEKPMKKKTEKVKHTVGWLAHSNTWNLFEKKWNQIQENCNKIFVPFVSSSRAIGNMFSSRFCCCAHTLRQSQSTKSRILTIKCEFVKLNREQKICSNNVFETNPNWIRCTCDMILRGNCCYGLHDCCCCCCYFKQANWKFRICMRIYV